ncbi:FLNB-like protein, partial [Mya arenaria]
MDAWPADSWATRKPVHHSRLRRVANRRKTTIKVSLLDRVLEVMRDIVEILLQYALYLWEHNPVKVLSRRHRRLYFVENYGEIMIKPKFRERVLDLLLSDSWRRQRLLNWVHKRLGLHVAVDNFSTSWQDGTALCALLESICPGVCPSYHLLPTHNRVKNCRLGLKLANKYLYLPMDLVSAEEMSIAARGTEQRLI